MDHRAVRAPGQTTGFQQERRTQYSPRIRPIFTGCLADGCHKPPLRPAEAYSSCAAAWRTASHRTCTRMHLAKTFYACLLQIIGASQQISHVRRVRPRSSTFEVGRVPGLFWVQAPSSGVSSEISARVLGRDQDRLGFDLADNSSATSHSEGNYRARSYNYLHTLPIQLQNLDI